MGNSFSLYNKEREDSDTSKHSMHKHNTKDMSLGDSIDYIASQYILSADFQSLRQLHEKEYCEKIVVLTSEIIDRYFTNIEINAIADRIENGIASTEKISFLKKCDISVIFFSNNETLIFKSSPISQNIGFKPAVTIAPTVA